MRGAKSRARVGGVRDGVLARKRTLDAVMQEEGEVRCQEEMAAVVKRLTGNPDL